MRPPNGPSGGSAVSAARRPPEGSVFTPNNLIHRNKVPNPIGMRVTARFDFLGGITAEEAEMIVSERLKIDKLMAGLIVRRRVYGTT